MPELPEVETVRRGLHERIVGKIIVHETHDTPKSFPNAPQDVTHFLYGATIREIRRRGKALFFELSSGYSLVVHLKMTGQLVYVGEQRFGAGHPNDSLVGSLPDASTRVTLTFSDGTALFFNDQRKFGWMKLLPDAQVAEMPFFQKLGPEPLEDSFTPALLYERLQRRKGTSIKAALLDQSVLAGVGNIYADESLWGAQLHPSRLVKSLSRADVTRIYHELREVMNLAIQKGGSSNHTYVMADGKKGSYMNFARVFRREGLACPRCETVIEKLRVAGRGTHICPHCQTI